MFCNREIWAFPSVIKLALLENIRDVCVKIKDIQIQLNSVGEKGRGESVWLGWFLISVLQYFAPVYTLMEDLPHAEQYIKTVGKIVRAIEKNAWDGQWYQRATFDNGKILGSVQNTECKIDAIAQSWAVLSGAAEVMTGLRIIVGIYS